MKSQEKWAVFFFLFGLVCFSSLLLIPVVGAIYGAIFFMIGAALFIFRNEESKIEKIRRQK